MTAISTTTSRRNRRRATWVGAGTALALGLGLAGSAAALGPVTLPPGTTVPLINLPPVPSAVATPNPVVSGGTLTLDGSASRDLDGSIVKWEFDVNGDGVYETRSHTPAVQRATATITGPSRLITTAVRVTDDDGAARVKTAVVRVHHAPVALLTADRAVPTVGDVVGYRATGSYDPDGGPVSFSWDLDGDGSFETATGANPFVTTSFASGGNQRLALRVRDSLGATTDRGLIVRVNARPTAIVSATPSPAVAGAPVALSGAASTDDRGITAYRWDLDGNGSYETDTGATSTTTTTFAAVGMATVGLEVTDTDGAVDRSTVLIPVNAAPVRDTNAPVVSVTPPTVRARSGVVRFQVGCPSSELFCRVTVSLTGLGVVRGRAVGRTALTVPGGEQATATVVLTPAARSALKRFRTIRAQRTVTASDAAGNARTANSVVTIRR